jgi:hypothetical protein
MKSLKQKTAWLWRNAEKILIVIFFLTFSLNIRKVFLTPYSFLNGGFNEYMTMSIGWADLLMLAAIVIYTTKYILSQVINPYYDLFNRKEGRGESPTYVSRETFYLLIFLGWVGLSIFWSQYRPIAVYRFLALSEIILFASVAVKCLKISKWLNIALFALILNGFLQSLLGIAQFVQNSSLGFRFLGESILGSNIEGVAKIIISNEKHIRAYGTFPHPNILAGFLIIPLFLLLREIISRRLIPLYKGETERGSGTNFHNLTPNLSLLRRGRLNNVSHETFLWFIPRSALIVILLITGIGFGLTFSRSAFLGLFVGLATYFFWIIFPWRSFKKSKVNFRYLVLPILVSSLIIIILMNKTSFFSNQSLQERQLYEIVSYETISNHPLRGVGAGQTVINTYYAHPNLKSWQYQPVHNIYLLMFSELGISGFVFFLLWIFSIMNWVNGEKNGSARVLLTNIVFYCMVFSFLIISLFDHYFWDIRQGTVIFVIPLIILFFELKKRKLDKEL